MRGGPIVQLVLGKPDPQALPRHIVIRWVVVISIWLHFLLISTKHTGLYYQASISILIVLTAYASVVTLRFRRYPALESKKGWLIFQILADTILFSGFYLLAGRPYSDLYLLYFLPLLIAAEYFQDQQVFVLFGIISLFFISSIVVFDISYLGYSISEALIHSVIPKWIFFFFVLFVAYIRTNILRSKTEEIEAVHNTAMKISKNESMDSRLEAIVEAAIQLLNVKGCKIYLKVPNKNVLKLVALKGLESDKFKTGYILTDDKCTTYKVIRDKKAVIKNNYRNSRHRIQELEDLIGAMMEVPLIFGENIIGVLGVFSESQNRKFTNHDTPILERLASYAAVAIHDIQLIEQVLQQTNAMKHLNSASSALLAINLDEKKIFHVLAEYAWNMSNIYNEKPSSFAYVGTLSNEGKYLRFKSAYPVCHLNDLRARIGKIDIENSSVVGIAGKAIKTCETQSIADVTRDQHYIKYDLKTRSQLAVPIKGRNRNIGVISIEHTDYSAFSEEVRENIEALARQAATALDNVELFRQIESQRERAESLRRASVKISSTLDLEVVAQRILEALHDVLPYSRGSLQIIEGDERRILAGYNSGDAPYNPRPLRPISEDDLIRGILESQEICILDPSEGHPYRQPLPETSDIKGWIGMPLIYVEKSIGLITIDSLEGVFPNGDYIRLLKLFSSHAASVLQNSIFFEQIKERIAELTQTQGHLESLIGYLKDHRNLALIGLVYGESFHYAENKLGMAKILATDVACGRYGHISSEIKACEEKIIEHINAYLKVLKDMKQKTLEEPFLTSLNLHQALEHVVASKQIVRHKVKEEFNARNPTIFAPEAQLCQVFYVIIQNALDAMGTGKGTLTLSTQMVRNEDRKFIKVSISDTGPGIPEHLQQSLFELKEADSSRRSHKGTGMGLFWARSFMRSYGGKIDFDTAPGKGTTMHVFVPPDFRAPIPFKVQMNQ